MLRGGCRTAHLIAREPSSVMGVKKFLLLAAVVALSIAACSGPSSQPLGLAEDATTVESQDIDVAEVPLAEEVAIVESPDAENTDPIAPVEDSTDDLSVVDSESLSETIPDELVTSEISGSSTQQVVNGCSIGPGTRCFGANLAEANLSAVNLAESRLVGVSLWGADLKKASMSQASLLWVNLAFANLEGADLADADLRWANLFQAKLSDANLSGAKYCRTLMPDGSIRDDDC